MEYMSIFEGNITIDEDSNLHGMIIGNVVVDENIHFNVHGMVIGNITCNNNSIVKIHGMIKGDCVNNNGYVEIFGTIKGKVIDTGKPSIVFKNAVINDENL